jgi:predicted nucleic acid-binding protein
MTFLTILTKREARHGCRHPDGRVLISVVTLAELRYGIERLAAGQRGRRLDE